MRMADSGRSSSKQFFLKQIFLKIFLEDWVLKLVALVITVALWLGVTGLSTPITKRFTVPLNFNIANDATITNSPIREVDVVLSGDKRRIEQMNRAELTATVDLSDVTSGDRVLSLTPDNVFVNRPQGIKVDEIQPSRIAVRIEAVTEKDVDVKAELTGQPASGFEIYGETITPPAVRVRGPVSFMRTLDFVQADAIDIAGASADVAARQVPVRVSNDLSAVLNTVVDVTVKIGEQRVERTFSVRVEDPLKPDAKRTAQVILFGGRSVIAALRAKDLSVEMRTEGGSEPRPQLVLPAELSEKIEIRKLKLDP